ncbi:MAG: 1-aminocyclopropane-1-carboxylate deaminase/D-cysteine desulfhydrase [Candidatus Dependentiae bacterium]
MNKFSLFLLTCSALLLHAQEPILNKEFYEKNDITVQDNGYWQWVNALNGCQTKPANNKTSETQLPLFNHYQELRKIPHISLCSLPTPVQELSNTNDELKSSIFIKRDDLSGAKDVEGNHYYGGNKPRKLEFELGQALHNHAGTVITFGGVGSNHALATSEYAKILGLKCIALLNSQPNSKNVQNNLLLHKKNETELFEYPDDQTRKVHTLTKWSDIKNNTGEFPYLIFPGASTPLGTVGFVNAAFELKEQIDKHLLPEPDYIYVPCGSFGTTIGLTLGCKAAGLKSHVVGICVIPEKFPGMYKQYAQLFFKQVNDFIHTQDQNFPVMELTDSDLTLRTEFTGSQYGLFTSQGQEALHLVKEKENITLDGTYTAKAFAALINDIKSGNRANKNILFWNTYCGLDFSNQTREIDFTTLPVCLHKYFTNPVQPLDLD